MEDEIKDIINKITTQFKIDESTGYGKEIHRTTLKYEEVKTLLDYITNLQKRNKELEDGFKATTEELCEYAEENEKLKSIIKEAREYTNKLPVTIRWNDYSDLNKYVSYDYIQKIIKKYNIDNKKGCFIEVDIHILNAILDKENK